MYPYEHLGNISSESRVLSAKEVCWYARVYSPSPCYLWARILQRLLGLYQSWPGVHDTSAQHAATEVDLKEEASHYELTAPLCVSAVCTGPHRLPSAQICSAVGRRHGIAARLMRYIDGWEAQSTKVTPKEVRSVLAEGRKTQVEMSDRYFLSLWRSTLLFRLPNKGISNQTEGIWLDA